MITILLVAIACCWFVPTFQYLLNFISPPSRGREKRRRNIGSLVAAASTLGWPLLLGRELKILPREVLDVAIPVGFALGVLACLIVLNNWSQR